MRVPFVDFSATIAARRSDFVDAFERVLDSGRTVLGPELEAFEQEFAQYCGVAHAIGVSNGLDALALTLRAAGVKPGDEVLVPSQTFIATWLAVSQAGATPVPVDIDPDTYALSAEAAEAAITPRTAAMVPVHLFGHPADMDALMALAGRRGLFVLEDAAQAHGARYKGRRCGSLGHAAAFSFYPTKNLGALGDAGAIVTDDEALARRIRMLRNYGSARKYVHEERGYNARLDELQAAILRVRLKDLDEANGGRRAAAAHYGRALAGINGLRLPAEAPWAEHVYHLYVVGCADRDALAAALTADGVDTLIHYPQAPLDQGAYRDLPRRSLPVGEAAARECLSLPMWPQMSAAQVEHVAAAIRRHLAG